ncbi:MAG TPA: GAF domain-containing protein [Bacillota bacterium]|nr:GAF domain-containing protein [Bacillota bacterium]
MFEPIDYTNDIDKNYKTLLQQLRGLIHDETNIIANLSNASALLNQFLEDINWVGFYLWEEEQLILGPFQGLPACIRIENGKGVCGTAMATNETMLVPNVHDFPGHIACDARSQSEIVIPMKLHGKNFGVLDIDSPNVNRFNETDQKYLEQFVTILVDHMGSYHKE